MEYENYLNQVIAGKTIALLCTYPQSRRRSRCRSRPRGESRKATEALGGDRSHLTDDSPNAQSVANVAANTECITLLRSVVISTRIFGVLL